VRRFPCFRSRVLVPREGELARSVFGSEFWLSLSGFVLLCSWVARSCVDFSLLVCSPSISLRQFTDSRCLLVDPVFSSRVGLATLFSILEFCFQEKVRLGLNSPASDIFATQFASFLDPRGRSQSHVSRRGQALGFHPLSSFCSSRYRSHPREQFRSGSFLHLSTRRSPLPACLFSSNRSTSERVWPPPVCSKHCSRLLFPPRSL
jgi:hypothetical protein